MGFSGVRLACLVCVIYGYSTVFGDVLNFVATTPASAKYCPSYCNGDGYYVRGRMCTSNNPYCCGNDTYRICCDNSTLDVSDDYEEVYVCANSSWWIFHWEVVIGLLGSMVIVLLVAACCCQCCATCGKPRRRSSNQSRSRRARHRRDDDIDLPSTISEGNGLHLFDPESPNAFVPPDYDSLPKDPPRYADLFGAETSGNSNEAFEPDTISNATLPPYEPPSETPEDSSLENQEGTSSASSETGPVQGQTETPLVAHVQSMRTRLADDLPPVRVHDQSEPRVDVDQSSISSTSSDASGSSSNTVIHIMGASDQLDTLTREGTETAPRMGQTSEDEDNSRRNMKSPGGADKGPEEGDTEGTPGRATV